MNLASLLPAGLSGYMLPGWLILILLVVAGVYALALMAMPFSVFGVKSRLEAIEDQLDAIRDELRVISLRQPEPHRASAVEEPSYDPYAGIQAPRQRNAVSPDLAMPPPPIPPPPDQAFAPRESFGRARPAEPRPSPTPPSRPRRIEPRLD